MARSLILLCLLVSVAACGARRDGRLPFDGQYFRASASPLDRADRAEFEVIVRQASKSESGARQAAAHEATAYCIRWFGRSDVAWQVAPDDEALRIQEDRLTVRGTCTG